MALDQNMSLERMRSFLKEELKEQILLEIAPILHVGQGQGGYFGPSRQILCFVDFLGALYHGYDEKKDKKYLSGKSKRREISKGEFAVEFIKDLMGEKIDQNYRLEGETLYNMYRHGLVHLYQPKSFLQSNGRVLTWIAYKGPRVEAHVSVGNTSASGVVHMRIITHPENANWDCLAISVNCLYYDLIQAIDIYMEMLERDKTLQEKFKLTANAISEFERL